MGWCSGTEIFDAVAGALLDEDKQDKKEILKIVINALENMDWDCPRDSDYWDHELIREIFKELHPNWFEY